MRVRYGITWFAVVVCATVAISGCGRPEPQFVNRDSMLELIPEAQEPLKAVLDGDSEKANENYFGTPRKLVVWEKFPIDYGPMERTSGTVIGEPVQPQNGHFGADLPEQSDGSYEGKRLVWRTGSNKGQVVKIADYDADEKTLTIKPGTQESPKPGDTFEVIVKEKGWKLKLGHELYMVHCLHCHGVSGDGNGPTADYLKPRPRDYREGKFKFSSTLYSIKPCRDDFDTLLEEGIPGTSMPSFKLVLKGDDRSAVIEYVRWLSTRGEFELRLASEFSVEYSVETVQQRTSPPDGEDYEEIVKELQQMLAEELPDTITDIIAGPLARTWQQADEAESVIVPKKPRTPATRESLARGRKVFLSKDTKCGDCHGPQGYGDGTLTEDYWDIVGTNPPVKHDKSGLYDDWGEPIKPRNLRLGHYRGGRRPIDIYRRVRGGIRGTPMPAFAENVLTDDQVWDLVNYILNMPFESATDRAAEQTLITEN